MGFEPLVRGGGERFFKPLKLHEKNRKVRKARRKIGVALVKNHGIAFDGRLRAKLRGFEKLSPRIGAVSKFSVERSAVLKKNYRKTITHCVKRLDILS